MALDVQGHRGARGLRPESTLPAFEVALDLMVTTLELDLHLTADDQVVIWHDEAMWESKCRLRPDAGDRLSLPAPIRSLTVSDLQYFECDRNPEPDRFEAQVTTATALAGDRFIPVTLAELFSFVDDYSRSPLKSEEQRRHAAKVEFNIETKRVPDHPEYIGDDFDGVHAGAFERVLIETLDTAAMTERSVIQSFDFRSLRAIHADRPDIRLSALPISLENITCPLSRRREVELAVAGTRPRHHETLKAGMPPQVVRPPGWAGSGDSYGREIAPQGVQYGENAACRPLHRDADATYGPGGCLRMTGEADRVWHCAGDHA